MQKRPLGHSGLSPAPLVFGGNVFGWTADKARSFELLDAFVDAGFNAVDTADAYSIWAPGHSGGESETIIGEWLKARGHRDDVLILTKPLGTGLITTALKNGVAAEDHVAEAIGWMTTLNRAAQEAVTDVDIHACSDITGFSLAGHASEIATKSGAGIELDSAALPVIDGALDYARVGQASGGLQRNRAHFEGGRVRIADSISDELRLLCFDPQTSGGLLLAVAPAAIETMVNRFESCGLPFWLVGNVTDGAGVSIA